MARRRLYNVFFTIAVLGTMGLVAVLALATLTEARLMPVPSASMTPTIRTDSLIAATPVRADDVHLADVLVFARPDVDPAQDSAAPNMIMHRVVELQSDGVSLTVRTKGDANAALDPWTIDLRRSALYRVDLVIPQVGRFYAAAHSAVGWSGAVLVWPGLVLLFLAVVAIRRSVRRRAEAQYESTEKPFSKPAAPGTGTRGAVAVPSVPARPYIGSVSIGPLPSIAPPSETPQVSRERSPEVVTTADEMVPGADPEPFWSRPAPMPSHLAFPTHPTVADRPSAPPAPAARFVEPIDGDRYGEMITGDDAPILIDAPPAQSAPTPAQPAPSTASRPSRLRAAATAAQTGDLEVTAGRPRPATRRARTKATTAVERTGAVEGIAPDPTEVKPARAVKAVKAVKATRPSRSKATQSEAAPAEAAPAKATRAKATPVKAGPVKAGPVKSTRSRAAAAKVPSAAGTEDAVAIAAEITKAKAAATADVRAARANANADANAPDSAVGANSSTAVPSTADPRRYRPPE